MLDIRLGLLVVVFCGCLIGCSNRGHEPQVKNSQPEDVKQPAEGMEVIHQGDEYMSGYGEKKFQVISSKEQYEAALLSYQNSDAARRVDFSAHKILLVDMGARSAQQALDSENITAVMDSYGVTVTLIDNIAGAGCVWPEIAVQPYIFLLVPTTQDILVREEWRINHCDKDYQSPQPESFAVQDIEIIEQGNYSYAYENAVKQVQLISSLEHYQQLLLNYPNFTVPQLDFSLYRVLLVDMGMRATTGYFIKLDADKTVEQNGRLILSLVYIFPDDNCVTGQALTNPFSFFKIPVTDEVLIREEIELLDCAL